MPPALFKKNDTNGLTPTILIVDNSVEDFTLLSRCIHKRWSSARIIHGNSKAILSELIQHYAFDIVLCDHMPSDIDSEQVHEILEKLGCDTPLILCSHKADEDIGIAAMNNGARDFVNKNRPDRLIPIIEREMATRQLLIEKNKMAQQAITAGQLDICTGIPNRSYFEELLHKVCNQEESTLLILISLEGLQKPFKLLRPGLEQLLIKEFSNQIKTLFEEKVLGRISEFEFAVALKAEQKDRALEFYIEQLYNHFENPILVRGQRFNLDIQLGCANDSHCENEPKALLAHAASTLRLIKTLNLQADVLLQNSFHLRAQRRQTIEYSLANALENHELQLYFQPVLSLPEKIITSVECLVRWSHPTLGQLSPDEFIGVAEESGLILPLGRWVLSAACQALKTLHQKGHELSVAINCATPEMNQTQFATDVINCLDEHGIERRFFELEITESAALTDFNQTIKLLEQLHTAGISLAIDDFGTGFSSLNYLRKLPADVLKIDKSFVQEMNDDEDSSKIIRAIIGLGTSLGLTIHAEGIEDAAQAQKLQAWGCNRLQGYWIAKPMELSSLIEWLDNPKNKFSKNKNTQKKA